MRIKLSSIFVADQQRALDFYTGVLGFRVRQDIPVGEYRWLSVASEEPGGAELSLEPNVNPAAKVFQQALFEQGIPANAFEVDDIADEVRRLSEAGVTFTMQPTDAGAVTIAVFEDTCGNLIQIYQRAAT